MRSSPKRGPHRSRLPTTMVSAFAPAKVNLTLHVTGQTTAGYHLLDSLVAFASVGDDILIEPAEELSLVVDGPEADGVPVTGDNLALKAAALLAGDAGARLSLTKRLPVSSGIGGGSADAAAAFRAMLVFGDDGPTPLDAFRTLPDTIYKTHASSVLSLGADVPMCLLSRPARATGIGEKLRFLTLPAVSAVLVNPRVPVATPEVFGALEHRTNAAMPDELPDMQTSGDLVEFLSEMRNDLQLPATAIAPVISDVLSALKQTTGCRLARMSGSGATCFALYAAQTDAGDAAYALRQAYPDWWVADCWLGNQMQAALPQRA